MLHGGKKIYSSDMVVACLHYLKAYSLCYTCTYCAYVEDKGFVRIHIKSIGYVYWSKQ